MCLGRDTLLPVALSPRPVGESGPAGEGVDSISSPSNVTWDTTLDVLPLMAIHALQRCLLARGVLLFMAINAGASLCRRVMKRGRKARLHAGLGRPGVAVHAGLLGSLESFFRPRRMVTGLAPVCGALDVKLVLELHAAHWRPLENDGVFGMCLTSPRQSDGQQQAQRSHTDEKRMHAKGLLHDDLRLQRRCKKSRTHLSGRILQRACPQLQAVFYTLS